MNGPITSIKVGKQATIEKLEGGTSFIHKLRTMGIREGKQIKIVAKQPLGGPLVVEVDNNKTTIGRGMAQRIIVMWDG